MKRAILASVKNLRYIGGILADWDAAGLNSVRDIEEHEHQRAAKKCKSPPGQKRGRADPGDDYRDLYL